MNVILIGYRGSGKSSVGCLLAARRGMTFIDLDDEVCARFGMKSIKKIWEEHGEAAFRELECVVVVELLGKDNQVIALGGGTVMQEDGRRAVAQAEHALRLYLKCDSQELNRRIHADPESAHSRPHLTDLGGGLREIRTVLERRDPVYTAVADHVLDVTHAAAAELVERIIKEYL